MLSVSHYPALRCILYIYIRDSDIIINTFVTKIKFHITSETMKASNPTQIIFTILREINKVGIDK